ncbi:terminase small subunit [Rhodospirillaceae bacterium SYSU D60014]|uniref:terminase small subunit n=1 Tax=Virgifigura deserti TaxID=2268457 RepID=UPI000E6612CD
MAGRPKGVSIEKATDFAAHYLKGGSASAAARAIGYAPASARKTASRLLKDPTVQEMIEKARSELQARASYSADSAMKELDQAMDFARETGNATALARVIELRAKLAGLMVERVDQRQLGGFQVRIIGVDDALPIGPRGPRTIHDVDPFS